MKILIKKSIIIFFITIIILLPSVSFSQKPRCDSLYMNLTFRTIRLKRVPPLSFYMPYEVMKGYIALDSISRNMDNNSFRDFLNRQTYYNDTIKNILKYMYLLNDYNPILFYTMGYDSNYKLWVARAEYDFIVHIQQFKQVSLSNDLTIAEAGIIAHIIVTDTVRRACGSIFTDIDEIVTCTIIDTIKGKVIPSCKDISIPNSVDDYRDPVPNIQPANPGSCLQFTYMVQNGNEPVLVDENGEPWIKKNREYIVFLYVAGNCRYQDSLYYDCSPAQWNGAKNYNLYPIENGIVQDPDDNFGIGTGLTVAEFKAKLRERIDKIINPDLTSVNEPSIYNTQLQSYNYPNPFDNTTTIIFDVPKGGSNVKIIISDYLGRRLSVITDSYYNEGQQKIEFNAASLSSGIYFYTIQAGSKITSNIMVLAR